MPGEDVFFFTWERVFEPPGFDEKVHHTTALVCLNEMADQSSTGQTLRHFEWVLKPDREVKV